jgi:hypothetical protein
MLGREKKSAKKYRYDEIKTKQVRYYITQAARDPPDTRVEELAKR